MAEEIVYTYSISKDTLNGKVDGGKLTSEIHASSITIALERIDTQADVLEVVFKDELISDSIDNQVTALTTVTVAVDTGAGTCTLTGTHAANSSDSYNCTVPSGVNHLTIAISPACSTGNGSKKYQLTDGTTTTSGTGSLVINFSNITGNISKNISITKSSTNC